MEISPAFPLFFGANMAGYVLSSDLLESPSSLVWEQGKARTMLLSVAIIAQSVLILSLRRLSKPIHKSLRQDWNWKIWPLMIAVPLFHAVLMYVPQTQYALSAIGIRFEIIQLASIDWLIVLALGLAPVALLELTEIMMDKRKQAEVKSDLQTTNKSLMPHMHAKSALNQEI